MRIPPFFVVTSFIILATMHTHECFAADTLDPSLAVHDTSGTILWYDIRHLDVEGRGWNETAEFYDRLPAKAENIVRKPVWSLSRDSAGMCVRFTTEATDIQARWSLRSENLAMPHMPATGVSGLDLYVKTGSSEWRWLANGRPTEFPTNTVSLVQGLPGGRRDYPVINLGFSGNGRMEQEIAVLLAELDPSVYVLDCLPNLTPEEVSERTEPFVRILRNAHPTTPVVLVEDRTYTNSFLVTSNRTRNEENRKALRRIYDSLKASGDENLYYIYGEMLLGDDSEGAVDGSHPTDLGFMRQAEAFCRVLAPILGKGGTR